jgi:hypothetical protein
MRERGREVRSAGCEPRRSRARGRRRARPVAVPGGDGTVAAAAELAARLGVRSP